jgi:Bacterial SH3 domain
MKPISTLLVCLILSVGLFAQNNVWYAAAKAGLSIREKPDAKAKVLEKIPYGEKLSLIYTNTDSIINITTEGISGSWAKTTYKGKTGYVVNSYLFPVPPPKATVKTLKDYLKQLSPVAGPAVTKGRPEKMGDFDYNTSLTKQLYKNGAELHSFFAYEYNSDTYFLPDFTIEQGFLLLRLLGEYPDAIGAAETYPQASAKKKLRDDVCTITVEKEPYGEPVKVTKKIRYEWQDGAYYVLEFFMLDGQLVILSSGGV